MKWTLGLLARLWLALSLSFVLAEISGNDPIRQMMGPQASAAEVQRVRALQGAQSSFYARYTHMLAGFVSVGHGNAKAEPGTLRIGSLQLSLGTSYVRRTPVARAIAERWGATASLTAAILLMQCVFGLGLALLLRRGATRAIADAGGAVAASLPAFVLAMVLQAVFAASLGWFPMGGFDGNLSAHLHALVLPALSMALLGATAYAKIAKDLWADIERRPYPRTARAKGASKARTFWVHTARNAMVPLVVMLAADAGLLLGGVVTVENVFRFPGLGTLAVQSVMSGDVPMLTGIVALATVSVSVCSVLGRTAARRLGVPLS